MGSSKKIRTKKRAQTQSSNGGFSDASRNFKTLFPVVQSPEGMKPPVLRNLYLLLANLSINTRWSVKCSPGSNDFDLETHHDGVRVTFEEISELSNILFKGLEEKFEQLFSDLRGDVPDKDNIGECSSNLGLFDSVDVVNLLFRCCLMLLTLLAAKQNLVLEKGVILLRIVKKSSSPDFLVEDTGKSAFVFEKSFFRQCAPGDHNGCSTSSVEGFTASLQFLGPNNPLLFFMSTILGVFVDELLAHGQLRGYFKMINAFASTNESLFSPHSAQEDIGIVIEVLCNHFILSFSDKQAFGDFLGRLFFTHATDLKYPSQAPSVSVSTAVSLLLSPIMVCAPKYMQAHLTSLVSESVNSKSLKPGRKLVNCFLLAFEKAVDLYLTHMTCLEKDGYPKFPRGCKSSLSRGIVHPPFEFYVSPDTKKKVDSVLTKLEKLANVNTEDIFFKMKSDMVSSSMRFVKECLNIYAISSQDEILAVLSCLVLKASGSYDEDIRPVEATNLQKLYFLASILKLMGISLLQAIFCVGNNDDDSCCMKSLKSFTSCKEHDFVMEIMTCFGDLDVGLPFQQELVNVMLSHPTRHVGSKMMFLHLLGLLSLSFGSGLHCLVKACLLVILALLNLFVFEEGDLDAFRALIDSAKNDSVSGLSVVRLQETMVNQNSSLVVASKFHKTRSLYSSGMRNKDFENETQSLRTLANASSSDMEAVEHLEEEETEETSNGEIFLKCMSKMGENVSDFDDLVGFVECKQGKDYPAWLKNRQKYRKWRFEKMAVLKWKKKKKTWRSLKGSKGKIN